MTNVITNLQQSRSLGVMLTLAIAMVLGWPMFGTYFFHPNQHMFAFGGDPLTLYYNVTYHTCYGSGSHLSSMSYPDGELIFLTDAQGSLSYLLSTMQGWGWNVCDYTVGIINSIAVWGYLLAALLMHLIFVAIGMPIWRAAIFGGLTAALAPHLPRMIGHHGLSHTFLLPLICLWLIRKFNHTKFEWRDLGVWLAILFFTFNNPYSGFGLGLLVFLTAIVGAVFYKLPQKLGIGIATLGLSPLLILFGYFKINDPFSDRIGLQWGYFHYKANPEGLLAPPQSLMDTLLKLWTGKGFNIDFEAVMNLGFPVTLLLVGFLIVRMVKKQWMADFTYPGFVFPLFWAGAILFLYASAVVFLPFPQAWVENVLGKLLMFKASARLAWPFWYVLIILAMVLLENFLRKQAFSGYLYTMILVCFTWLTDYQLFRKPVFNDTVQPNFFGAASNEEMARLLADNKVDPKAYQAIFLLPKLMTWTDHFQSEPNFFNQFFGMRLSRATGLPLVSAMLSRMSIGQTAERIEFLSDPLVEKSLHLRFPDKRPLLLLRGKGNPPLKWGEQYLISLSDTLIEHKDFTLLSLPLEKINVYPLLSDIKARKLPIQPDPVPGSYFYEQGTQIHQGKSYFGDKCIQVTAGETEVASFTLTASPDSICHFSAWSFIDYAKYDLGTWSVRWYENGNEKGRAEFPLHQSSEVHDHWVRADLDVKVCQTCNYKVYFNANRPAWVDEILVRPMSRYHLVEAQGQSLYNGFRIDRK